MSDEPQPQPPAPARDQISPASNQNLIIGLVMGAAILLLFFLVFNNQNAGTASRDTAEVEQLKDRLAALKRESLQASLPQNYGVGTNNYGVDPVKLADEISKEANALAGLIGNFSSEIQQKEALIQTARDTEALLNRRIQDLQRQMNDLSSSAAESLTLRKELESLKTLYDNAQRQIEELRKRPDSATLDELRRQNDELRTRLAALSDLEADNSKLRSEIARLQALLDRSSLYVESADQLPAVAQRLYRELERLEDYSPSQLQEQYTRIEAELNARPLRSVNFKTGSATLTNEQVAVIANDLQSAHPSAFLLVVGYASKTGNFDSNRQLSADRATSVASRVNAEKKATQKVQAVFLNETSRFSKEQDILNQICEIWEIRP